MNRKLCIILLWFGFFAIGCFGIQQQCTVSVNNEGMITNDCPDQYDCLQDLCVHKDIFPITGRDIAGTLLVILIGGFANAAGTGGGSILSPVLLVIFNYDANKTIMLAYVLMFGGSLGTFLNVAFERDIHTGRPIVLYDFVLMVGPMMLLGANIGVLLNRTIPPIVPISGLVCLMIFTFRRISQKAKATYASETQLLNSPLITNKKEENTNKSDNEATGTISLIKDVESQNEEEQIPAELKKIIDEEESFLPGKKIFIIICLLAFQILVTIIRGTDKFPSLIGVESCSLSYWGWFIFGLAGSYLFFLLGSRIVQRNIKIKKEYNYTVDNYNVTSSNINILGLLGILAGTLAALLGIGASLILGTAMMEMGVGPQSMTASSICFVLLTTFISLFQAFLLGGISSNELIFFFLVSSIGSFSFSVLVQWIVRKFRRPSILLIILAAMLIIAIFILPSFALWRSIQNPLQMFSFNPLC